MSALTDFKKVIGNKPHGSGGDYLINFAISGCTDFKTVNLRTASYRLDYGNKLLLIELLKAMVLKEEEIWDEHEILSWIEENQPYVFKEAMKNTH